jgi:ATP-binding cassette subfamily B protein
MLLPVAEGLAIRSVIPGRIRWYAPKLQHQRALADEIRHALRADAKVRRVEANPNNGSVLVVYEAAPGADEQALVRELTRQIVQFLRDYQVPPEVTPRQPAGNLATAAMFVAVPATVVAFTTASPLLVATSIGAIVASVLHFADTLSARGELAGASVAGATVRRVQEEIRPFRRPLIAAGVLGVAAVSMSLGRFVLLGMAFEMVVPTGASEIPIEKRQGQIVGVGVMTIVTSGLLGLFEYWGQRIWRTVASALQHRLRLVAYQTLQRAELSYVEGQQDVDFQAIVLEDVQQIEQLLSIGWDVLEHTCNIVLVMIVFFRISPGVAWLAFFGVSLTIFSTSSLQKAVVPRARRLRQASDRLAANTTTSADGLATIKSFAAETVRLEKMRDLSEAQLRLQNDVSRVAAAYVPAIEMSVMTSITASTVAGGLLSGESISVASYSTMIMLTRQLLLPLTQLGRTVETFHHSFVALERLYRFLDGAPLEQGGPLALPRRLVRGEIHYRDISFDYAEGEEVLRRVNIDVEPGRTTAIVGPTGSGKSTLLRLLLRLRRATSGVVLLDGHDVSDIRLPDLRRCFSMVSQEVYLFAGTLRENIVLGKPEATPEEVRAAARVAGADDFIMAMPERYETVVGERGLRLSGGERQRVAIARAVLADTPVLILDEATSHLDNETEASIHDRLHAEMGERTTIVVAHRLAVARRAHRIYVLERGRIVESGAHDELVAHGGLYSTLWRLQTAG